MGFSSDIDFGRGFDVNDSRLTKRLDKDERENEIEGGGDANHMKESQEESTSIEAPGQGGLAGLIANLSGVMCI